MNLTVIWRSMLGACALLHILLQVRGQNFNNILQILGATVQNLVAQNLCTPAAVKYGALR